jgi:hypothetical protein
VVCDRIMRVKSDATAMTLLAPTPRDLDVKEANDMTTDVATKQDTALLLERVIVGGDLSKLTATERVTYYAEVCKSVGLNPLTQPFAYLYLQNKMVLYARKEATEQLRHLHGVSITKLESALADGILTVTAYGHNKAGRTDAATGAVSLEGKRGQEKADLCMKAETKAKRRLTLSLCGLGMLDESEVEIPPTAVKATESVVLPHATPLGTTGISVSAEQHDSEILFPTPEADRAGLIQRARIAMARSNKQRVADLKQAAFGGHGAELEKVDLAALVSFVRDLEEEKL